MPFCEADNGDGRIGLNLPTPPSTLYRNATSHNYMRKWDHDRHHMLIGQAVLRKFDLAAGDTVIEVGAGFGRYTSLLRDLGLRVISCEPDPAMFAELASHFSNDDGVETIPVGVEALDGANFHSAKALCGFHVLHHLTPTMLETLAEQLETAFTQHTAFQSWFFLEPNHFNPLFVLQTLIDPAMSFSEERGIWLTQFSKHMSTPNRVDPYVGAVGLFPPRSILAGLPEWSVRWGTRVQAGFPRPYNLYRLFGLRKGA
jgi:SAM-dependent methyltransferase